MANKNLEYRGFKSTELMILIFLTLAGTALAWIGKLTPEWVNLISFLFGSFVVGRVGSKASEAYRDGKQPPNPAQGVT
jgi:uncharacterized membrane protein YfcA